jgi:hypothetical protein
MAKIAWYVVMTTIQKVYQFEDLRKIAQEISEKFGGLTNIQKAQGLWFNPQTANLEIDNTDIWEVLTNDVDTRFAYNIAKKLKVVTNQKVQLFAIRDKPFYVEETVKLCANCLTILPKDNKSGFCFKCEYDDE